MKETDDVVSELKNSVMKKNRESLSNFMISIDEYMNPFDPTLDKDKLFNMTNGEVAAPDVEKFLLNVEKRGNLARETFIAECTEDPNRYELPIKKNKVYTFAKAVKKQKIVVADKVKEVRLQRDLFGRLLALSVNNNIDIQKVLCYPITPVPLSLSHMDGTICKTDKSQLLKIVESKVVSEAPKKIDIIIIDGFFLINSLKELPRTFGDLSKKNLNYLCQMDANRIDLIFDRYFTPSIKDTERILRGRTQRDYQISGPQQVRPIDFAKELKNMKFKEALVTFLIKHWTDPNMPQLFGTKIINVNHDECYEFRVKNGQIIRTINEDLTCDIHEEADTKIIYHACKIRVNSNVVIRYSDTDVLIIMLGNMEFLQSSLNIWIDFGTGNARRYIDVSLIYAKMGPLICSSMPGFHAITGCDYNPSFFRKGKKKPFETLLKYDKFQKALISLGDVDIDAAKPAFDILEEFVCHVYKVNKTRKVNEGRYEIFLKTYNVKNATASFKLAIHNFDASNLPTCHAELHEHLLRALYITKIWRNAHQKNPVGDSNPTDCGWVQEQYKLGFRWFKGEQLPPSYSDVITDFEDTEDHSDEEGDMNESAEIGSDRGSTDGASDDSDDDYF